MTTQVRLRLRELEGARGADALVAPLCQVLKLGVEDKIAQVYISTLDLLDDVATLFGEAHVSRKALCPPLEPTIATLAAKLGENHARVREQAFDALLNLAHCRSVGCGYIATCCLKRLGKKASATKWRPIATRLLLLKQASAVFFVCLLSFFYVASTRVVCRHNPRAHDGRPA